METNPLDKEKLNDSEESKHVRNGTLMPFNLSENFQNTTEIDLSKRNIEEIGESISLPPCLRSLNLSGNTLREVPKIVLNLKDLRVLDVSYNKVEYFNDTPSFCQTIEYLNVSNNKLKSPPIWIWLENAKNLSKLDISCNVNISELLKEHIDELLQYSTSLKHVILHNCRLGTCLKFFGSFQTAKELEIGAPDWSFYPANHLQELPCQGLDKCCDIEKLILINTHIYTITPEIKIFKNLKEINLSQNKLNGLPTEFGEFEHLEICILSHNNILYLPNEIVKLEKLTVLCIAANKLCMIPENITDMVNLRVLDLYDNDISEISEGIKTVPEIDLAQNYFDEPDDQDYLEKREKFRLQYKDRLSGRKFLSEKPETEYSPDTTDDEEFIQDSSREPSPAERPSSPEDWDSDSYWEPHPIKFNPPSGSAYWMTFAKKAMENGNLCPMDNHPVPIIEMVNYEKMCYPKEEYESDGQFDDYPEDDS